MNRIPTENRIEEIRKWLIKTAIQREIRPSKKAGEYFTWLINELEKYKEINSGLKKQLEKANFTIDAIYKINKETMDIIKQ